MTDTLFVRAQLARRSTIHAMREPGAPQVARRAGTPRRGGWLAVAVRLLALLGMFSASRATDVLTMHNDNMRSGVNLGETVLNQANVELLGMLVRMFIVIAIAN